MVHVYLHGFAGGPRLWDDVWHEAPLTPGVQKRERPCLPWHQRAGASSFTEACTQLWSPCGAEPIHLTGYSLGARLALGMACQAPDRVASLTLIGVHPGLVTDAARAERAEQDGLWATLLQRQGMAKFSEAWGKQPLFTGLSALSPARMQTLRDERLALNPLALANALTTLGLAAMPCWQAYFDRLTMPVHLITGAYDVKFTALAAQMLPSLPDGRHTVIAKAGHNVVLEAPEAYTQAEKVAQKHTCRR
jgi:2-succinyl-6-hydroxy-2,4-cyclohexadiene-1-carboxylate synthase